MPNPIKTFSIVVSQNNIAPTQDFFNELLEWNINNNVTENYLEINPGSGPDGGLGELEDVEPNKLILFFHVDDIEYKRNQLKETPEVKYVSTIKNHPKGGKFLIFRDPNDIPIGLYQCT